MISFTNGVVKKVLKITVNLLFYVLKTKFLRFFFEEAVMCCVGFNFLHVFECFKSLVHFTLEIWAQ